MTPVAVMVGANRIVPAAGIIHPLGNVELSAEDEKALRRRIVERALRALATEVVRPTVFTGDEPVPGAAPEPAGRGWTSSDPLTVVLQRRGAARRCRQAFGERIAITGARFAAADTQPGRRATTATQRADAPADEPRAALWRRRSTSARLGARADRGEVRRAPGRQAFQRFHASSSSRSSATADISRPDAVAPRATRA
jgi:glycine reductase